MMPKRKATIPTDREPSSCTEKKIAVGWQQPSLTNASIGDYIRDTVTHDLAKGKDDVSNENGPVSARKFTV